MLWPERPDNWREGARFAQEAFALVADAIAESEPVTMGASAGQVYRAEAMTGPGVRVVEMPSDDAWMRDVGPTCVVNREGEMRGVSWRFNAWGGRLGGLYPIWEADQQVAGRVLEVEGAACYQAPLVLEGGSIHCDGQGTVLTTEECLLNPNRNPDLSREEIEAYLLEYLGARKVIWLGRGLENDETSGHVDNLACFARPGEVLLHWTDDTGDANFSVCRDAEARLLAATDARGCRFTVHRLPQPGPLYITEEEAAGVAPGRGVKPRLAGERLAASYVNFFIANRRIVAPLLDERTDQIALEILARVFPEREVVGVPAREILLGGGNIHCITQQIPGKFDL